MSALEIEKTYLAKYLPAGLLECTHKEIIDLYAASSTEHSKLRLRKNGDRYEITKKSRIEGADASQQTEETIHLSEQDFLVLASIEGERIRKIRYFFPYNGMTAEFDVFQDQLEGLVLVDFEFETLEEYTAFTMPDFCLADVTQEDCIAGINLCGKTFIEVKNIVSKYNP